MQENRSYDSYFGTYPGADGIPMRHGVPTVCVPNPAGGCDRPYHDTRRRQRRRPARRGQRGRRHQPRQDGRLHPAAGRGQGVLQDPRRPGLHRRQRRARRDGLPHRRGDTELLGLRQELRAAGPHVRAGEVVVAARAPVPGLRLVGAVQEPLADELRQQHRRPLRGQHVRRGGAQGADHRQDLDRPGLDRHHLAALRQACELGLLRAVRIAAGLRQRLGRDLRGGQAERLDAGDLEPAAAVRRRAAGPPAAQHPAARQLPPRPPARAPCPR